MVIPPKLKSGDQIRVVAPSGPFDADLLKRGLDRLTEFQLEIPRDLYGRQEGFLAGSDQARLRELQAALDCPTAGAILIARGGYGLGRILPQLDFRGLLKYPKWVAGFSDATVLHAALSRLSFASLHSPNGTTLAKATTEDAAQFKACLLGDLGVSFANLESWVSGSADGVLFGGNLTVLFAEAAALRLKVPDGCILLLEDVTETSYRVDRMLDALIASGALSKVSGVVLGAFEDCTPGKFAVPTSAVLKSALQRLSVPVLSGVPIGHGARNATVLLGGHARLRGESDCLEVSPP